VTTVRDRIDAVLGGAVGYETGLDALTVAPPGEVDPALLTLLHERCARLWRTGWQPEELHRYVTRKGRLLYGPLVADAVAAHLSGFPPSLVDPRWLAQADAVDAKLWWHDGAGYLEQVGARWRLDRVAVLDDVLTLLGVLGTLPPIEVLLPPPGTRPATAAGAAGVDPRILDRVRNLLAKAESSTYPAEAEAYTAKAQQLVARHSIEEALLTVRSGDAATVVPFARRIAVEPPYEGEKAALLDAVARANRCHLVWSPEFGFATVFGFDADVDAVDLLHTSLLVQANRAMAQAEPSGGKAGRARLKTFRQSFLVAYSVRIGERLATAAAQAIESALAEQPAAEPAAEPAVEPTAGPAAPRSPADLLPVLASRDEQVRETMHRVFPRTVRSRGRRVESAEGWHSGRAAADRATLPG
jgi:hypothetical protein